jgi:membrane-bound lytic murein transglycosylase B
MRAALACPQVRAFFAVLLAAAAVAGLTVALAQQPHDDSRSPAASPPATEPQPLPGPDSAISRNPARLAATLTATTRRLHEALRPWDAAGEVPRDVTYLALHHQRMLRLMAERRALGDATLARLPRDVRGEARDTVIGRRHLAAIPRSPGRLPRVRVAEAAPAAELRRHYAAAQRRFGVHWSILASINFVESAFGRVRSASEAGARGPMQFLPSTWREYGMGGDIDDPRDAILAAANYLRRAGAPGEIDRALFAYNHSTSYVRAIRRFARRMRVDGRAFLSYYAWQVFVRTPTGVRRLTGPGRG